jgi:hypothetical protein
MYTMGFIACEYPRDHANGSNSLLLRRLERMDNEKSNLCRRGEYICSTYSTESSDGLWDINGYHYATLGNCDFVWAKFVDVACCHRGGWIQHMVPA